MDRYWHDSPSLIRMTPNPEDDVTSLHKRPIPPAPSSSSSLFAALDVPPPQPIRPTRISPSPFYNPYPYAKTWTLERKLNQRERDLWHNREDDWMRHMDGEYITEVRQRVCSVYTNGVRTRQLAARKEWEEARLLQRPPPKTSADSEDIDHAMDFQFITSREDKGIPVKTLMSGRRAIEGMLMSPKGKVFEKYPHDTIEVRIKWPAYPDHEPVRTIVVTVRTGKKQGRRPCTTLEFAVALAGLVTQFYSEVSRMEPHPAFTHLALGPGEGRISLYALRMMGIRAGPKGIFELELELNGAQPSSQDAPTTAESSSVVPAQEVKAEPDPVAVIKDEVKAAQWPHTLPVTCTIASPPKISAAQYLAHVDPIMMGKVPLPAWPEK